MDPLSISASIAGLIALTTGLINLTHTLRTTLKEDAAGLIITVSVDIELLNGTLLHLKTWVDTDTSNGRHQQKVLSLSPFVEKCTDVIRKLGEQLLALETASKKKWPGKLFTIGRIAEKLKALEGSRVDLERAKTSLMLALQVKEQDISTSLDEILKKLGDISLIIPQKSSKDDIDFTEFIGPGSFDAWLETFTHTHNSPNPNENELEAYREKKRQSSRSPRQSSSTKTEPCDPDIIYLQIQNLKTRSGEFMTEDICVGRDSTVFDLIYRLHKKGHENICGFRSADGDCIYAPYVDKETPNHIRVTSGSSTYDHRKGLRINENERLIDYYNDFLDKIEPSYGTSPALAIHRAEQNSGLYLKDTRNMIPELSVSFHRSLRLPDDGNVYTETTEFGTYPLLSVADFDSKMPTGMKKKGGYFFPMFQREALSLGFTKSSFFGNFDSEAFAIKVFAGSVNAVSGQAGIDTSGSQKQDFIVIPKQGKLDGVSIGQGIVQQFVAMPLSWNYSLEKQVTGAEYIGGLQLQIAAQLNTEVQFFHDKHQDSPILDYFQTPQELKSSGIFMKVLHRAARDYLNDTNRIDDRARQLHQRWLKHPHQRRLKHPWYEGFLKHHDQRHMRVHELELRANGTFESMPSIPIILEPIGTLKFVIKDADSWSDTPKELNVSALMLIVDFFKMLRIEYIILLSDFTCIRTIDINNRSIAQWEEEYSYSGKYLPLAVMDVFQDGTIISIGQIPHLVDTSSDSNLSYTRPSSLRSLNCLGEIESENPDNFPIRSMLFDLEFSWTSLRRSYRKNHAISQTRHDSDEAWPDISSRPTPSARKGLDGWEMAIGVHGKILQDIRKTNDTRLWNWRNSKFINVQIVNSVVFEHITGLTSLSPIPVKLSETGNLTASYSTNIPFLTASTKALPFRSIGQIDIRQDTTTDLRIKAESTHVGCACCERNFCNVIFEPCRHIFCDECVDVIMLGHQGQIFCDACDVLVDKKIYFSSTMEMPQDSLRFSMKANEDTNLSVAEVLSIFRKITGHSPQENDIQIANFARYFWGVSEHIDGFWMTLQLIKRLCLADRISLLRNILQSSAQWADLSKTERPTVPRVALSEMLNLVSAEKFIEAVGINFISKMLAPDRSMKSELLWVSFYFNVIFCWFARGTTLLSKLNIPLKHFGQFLRTSEDIEFFICYLTKTDCLKSEWNSLFLKILRHSNCVKKDTLILRFLDIGFDVNTQNEKGHTALHIAVSQRWEPAQIKKGLLALGSRVDVLDADDHLASFTEMEVLCAAESAKGIVNVRNKDGHTPWHLVLYGSASLDLENAHRALLRIGADPKMEMPKTEWRASVLRMLLNLETPPSDDEVIKLVDDLLFNEYYEARYGRKYIKFDGQMGVSPLSDIVLLSTMSDAVTNADQNTQYNPTWDEIVVDGSVRTTLGSDGSISLKNEQSDTTIGSIDVTNQRRPFSQICDQDDDNEITSNKRFKSEGEFGF